MEKELLELKKLLLEQNKTINELIQIDKNMDETIGELLRFCEQLERQLKIAEKRIIELEKKVE